ncbi:hypothetical protein EFB08_17290 [Rufibacter latericius]|uniref:Uncharacterized protein n=1 Tax=Rufibacter latericius TaxID=2487040 RepID=A0A3M9MHI5_9BACT|nr:hypothetical protein EFB08_17290 [Rufibacter latericius]
MNVFPEPLLYGIPFDSSFFSWSASALHLARCSRNQSGNRPCRPCGTCFHPWPCAEREERWKADEATKANLRHQQAAKTDSLP